MVQRPSVAALRKRGRAEGGLNKEAKEEGREGKVSRGLTLPSDSSFSAPVAWFGDRQAAAGIFEADSVIFMVDGQEGLTGSDREVMDWLRVKHSGKPVVLAVNKCESPQKADLQVRGAPPSTSACSCGGELSAPRRFWTLNSLDDDPIVSPGGGVLGTGGAALPGIGNQRNWDGRNDGCAHQHPPAAQDQVRNRGVLGLRDLGFSPQNP